MSFQGPNNAPNQGAVQRVLRCTWSNTRVFHGAEVTLTVRTENVNDGEKITLQILPKGANSAVDEVKDLVVQKGKVETKYTIDWKGKALPAGNEFVFKATHTDLTSDASSSLVVDLGPPFFSA